MRTPKHGVLTYKSNREDQFLGTDSDSRRRHTASRLLFCSMVSISTSGFAAQQSAPEPPEAAVLAQLGCFDCHGEDGISNADDVPNLAGLDWSYLMRQLRSYADPDQNPRDDIEDDTRYHYGMEATTRGLSYDRMDRIATYFSKLVCIPANTPDPERVPEPVKQCARCHGLYGVNLKIGVPDLSGQKRNYLQRQLQAFRASRSGADPLSGRQPRYSEAMDEHAVPLSDEDIDVIVDYFSSLSCS